MMNTNDRIVLEHLKRPLNGRTYKEIMVRTDLSFGRVQGALARLREAGLLDGWDVTESGRREICPARRGT